MAILIEHTGGRWPFWLSPRQIVVCPVRVPALPIPCSLHLPLLQSWAVSGCCPQVSSAHDAYANQVAAQLSSAGYFVDVDATSRTIPKRIRAAQVAQYNLILVVGDKEVGSNTVTVRFRDDVTQASVKEVAEVKPDAGGEGNTIILSVPELQGVCAKLRTAFK